MIDRSLDITNLCADTTNSLRTISVFFPFVGKLCERPRIVSLVSSWMLDKSESRLKSLVAR